MKRFSSKELQEHEILHNRLVRERAAECTLFLKRNGDFPIMPCKVNLYGSGARRTVKGGKGSGDVNTRYTVSIEQGLENAGFEIATKAWLGGYDAVAEKAIKEYWDGLYKKAEALHISPYALVMSVPKPPVEYDLLLDGSGDVNIFVISRESSEGVDRVNGKGDYLLLDSEVRDILYLAGKREKFMLVLNVGGVVDLSPVLDCVGNILLLGQLGAETGNTFADILTGKSVPSGKLTATWAKNYADYPSSDTFGTKTEVNYQEGVFVGYRYFESFHVKSQFPFGFGHGYTDFDIFPKSFEIDGNFVKLGVEVKNVGKYFGKEVVEVYCIRTGVNDMPCKQLIAFAKTELLQAGESTSVTVKIDVTRAAVYEQEESAFVLRAGKYLLEVGNSIENTVCAAAVVIEKDFTLENVHRLTAPKIEELNIEKIVPDQKPILGEKVLTPVPALKQKNKRYLSPKVNGMSDEELARLCVGVLNDMTLDNNIGNSGKQVAGAAGETYSDENILPLVLADGPAGLRISPTYQLDENGKVKASENALAGLLPGGAVKCEQGDGELFYQYCTAIPVGTALAQSWNMPLCKTMGDLVGKEMELFGVDIWLAPALNIQRNPLCGRNFEYYSEDPLLSGLTAAAIVNGVQQNAGRSVTVKHYCANNQETDRFFSSSNLSERALREIYLKAFRICIETSAPDALMTSYNLVNGSHTANSKELLETVLREEWGYEGLIMTDWLSTGGMGTGVKYSSSSACECIAFSNDLIMPGRDEDLNDILSGIKTGRVTRKNLEESASRILCLSERKSKL